jgi:fused signal recognition particle receptor
LARGLTKTRDALRGSVQTLFATKAKLSSDQLEKLHEALYRADVGVATADKLVDHVRTTIGRDAEVEWEAVAAALKERAREILAAPQTPLAPAAQPPWVILVVGVNGVGKTTTIGKLAAHFLAADKKVLLAAADTFRAAAIEQLRVWGDRLGVDVVHHKSGSDPAAVAYDGVKAAMARGADVLLIDTAGRLHSKNELMAELGKINRVIGKDLPGAPHETWLVIDATTGQNAVAQVKAFREVVALTGLVVTKLDGTAKGGVLIGIADQFGLPIRYVGVGEKAADLRAFAAEDYVESLF